MKIIEPAKKYVQQIFNRKMNIITKFITFVIVLFLMFIPTYIFSFFWSFLSPETFWEKFVMVAGGIFLIGWIQVGFLIVGVVILFSIFFDN